MLGEKERRDRFAYALQRALRVQGLSERELAKRMGIDPRKVARWRSGKAIPDYYETLALAEKLGVREDLFRDPPAIPPPPPEPHYPIEDYLIDPAASRRNAEIVLGAEALAREDLEREVGPTRVVVGEPADKRRKRPA